MPYISSLDVAFSGSTGICTIDFGSKLKFYDVYNPKKAAITQHQYLRQNIRCLDEQCIVFEGQYVDKNPDSALKCARGAGIWESFFIENGFDCVYDIKHLGPKKYMYIKAITWQSKILKGLYTKFRRKELKIASVKMAELDTRIKMPVDAADAYGMCKYSLGEMKHWRLREKHLD